MLVQPRQVGEFERQTLEAARARRRRFAAAARPADLAQQIRNLNEEQLKERSETGAQWFEDAWRLVDTVESSAISRESAMNNKILEIQRRVASHFGFDRKDLVSRSKAPPITLARHVAMFICRQAAYRSYTEIARRFGRSDHTSSLFAERKIAAMMRADEFFAASVAALAEPFGGLRRD